MTSFFEDCIEDLPINIEDIKKFAHNPQIHIKIFAKFVGGRTMKMALL